MITNMYNHQNHHHRDAVVSTREPTASSHRDRCPKADSGHPSLINRRAKSREITTYNNEYIMINPFTSSWSPLNVKNKLTVHTAIKNALKIVPLWRSQYLPYIYPGLLFSDWFLEWLKVLRSNPIRKTMEDLFLCHLNLQKEGTTVLFKYRKHLPSFDIFWSDLIISYTFC